MLLFGHSKKIVYGFLHISIAILFQTILDSGCALAQEDQTSVKLALSGIGFDSAQIDQHTISFAYSGDDTKPGVLFLHGTPGGWNAFDLYLSNPQLQKDFFMISVDRLGWGRSPLPANMINGDFTLQARSVAAVMNLYPKKNWTIVGHSLGASMAPKIAIMSPKNTHSLLLLAGSLDPKLGKPRWYNSAANTWLVSRLIGKSMRYSNREIMGLKKQLKQMDIELKDKTLNSKLVVMQGQKDRLVSPKNPTFVELQWQQNFASVEIIRLPNEGHFLPWRQTRLVIESIYSLRDLPSPQ